jgi:glycogen(starch) synthase
LEPFVKTTKKNVLFEIAWEVCNQVGGIYTVIRTKVPAMVEKWDENYFLLGPYFEKKASSEFEIITDLDDSPAGRVVKRMREMGYTVFYGYWLVTGKPRVVLFELDSIAQELDTIKFNLWERSRIPTINVEPLVNQTLCFGELVRIFLKEYAEENSKREEIYAQFHEWMASSGIPDLKRENVKIATTFTTHATMLGRYRAQNVSCFYGKLPFFNG